MRALGDDPAPVQHHDPVGFLYRGKAMRHDQRGAAFAQSLHRLLHGPLAFGIECRGRLVQQQDRRVAQDGAGDGDALLLPAGQHDATFAHEGIVALRQGAQEIMRGSGAGGRDHLGLGRLGAAKADVLGGGGGKDHRVLRDHRDGPAEVGAGEGRDIHAVDGDAPLRGIVEPQKKLQDRRFACATGAHQRHRLARPDLKVHAVQRRNLGPRRIAEADTVEPDGPPHGPRQCGRRCGVQHRVHRLHQLYQPLGGTRRALQLAPDFGQGAHGARHHHGIDQELDQLSGRHRARLHVPRADPQDTHDPAEGQEDDDHRHHRPRSDPRLGTVKAAFGHLRELGAARLFMGKGLHRLHRKQRLGRVPRGLGDPVLILAAQAPQAATEDHDGNDDGGHDEEDQPRQLGRGQHQRDQPPRQHQHVPQGDRNGRPDHRQDQRGVRGQAAEDLSRQDALEEGRRQAEDAVEHRPADVGHDPLAQPRHEVVAKPRPGSEKRGNPKGGGEIAIQKCGIVRVEPVHHPPHGKRQHKRDPRRQHQRRQRQHQPCAIGPQERHQTAQRPHLFRLGAILGPLACLGHAFPPVPGGA